MFCLFLSGASLTAAAAAVAAGAGSVATAINNVVNRPVMSVVGIGGGGGGGSTSTSGSFLNSLSTFPFFQLSGISGHAIIHLILIAFLLYVSIILWTDGDLLAEGVFNFLTRGGRSEFELSFMSSISWYWTTFWLGNWPNSALPDLEYWSWSLISSLLKSILVPKRPDGGCRNQSWQ